MLQTPEISSNLSYRLCTAEVRGSNPLGSTPEIADLQVKFDGKEKAFDALGSLLQQ
jgi:hypothetical protein